MIPLIVIEGPTASGKTALALALAEHLKTEIISADSRQVYRLLNIGTAKPSREELSRVRHHFIDIIWPDEIFNAGRFRTAASTLITALHLQGKIPIVCGGTGLYVKALLEGLFKSEIHDPIIRQKLEKDCEELGLDEMYDRLYNVDLKTADKVGCFDRQRILRALEVYLATGIPISEHWRRQVRKEEFKAFRIFMNEDRDVLYQRIDARIHTMLDKGLLDEIKTILKKGYDWTDPGFNSVGYKEFQPFIETGEGLGECIALAQQHSRNYAKRQLTWYRKCNFHLAASHLSINIKSVTEAIQSFFDIN